MKFMIPRWEDLFLSRSFTPSRTFSCSHLSFCSDLSPLEQFFHDVYEVSQAVNDSNKKLMPTEPNFKPIDQAILFESFQSLLVSC